MSTNGQIEQIHVKIAGVACETDVIVLTSLAKEMLIGINILKKLKVNINFKKGVMMIPVQGRDAVSVL